jgi:cytochrome b561
MGVSVNAAPDAPGMWADELAAPVLYSALYALVLVLAIAGSALMPWGWAVPL